MTTRKKSRKKANEALAHRPLAASPSRREPELDVYAGLTQPGANLVAAYLHRFDRAQTRRAYRNDLTQFFGTDSVDARLAASVSFLHINEHVARLEQSGAKATTIKRRVSALRGFFEWLHALDIIEKNPAHKQLVRRVRTVRRRDQSIVFLSAEQADRLVSAADDGSEAAVRNRALILTLLHCVLRRSEAAAMDFENIRPLGSYWILDLANTKGGADQYVKVPDSIVEEIEAVRLAYGYESGPVWRSLSRNSSRGNRLSPAAIYEVVRNTASKAALPVEIGAHTLRHTGCTLAIEAGASLQQVKDHARHKNVETTMVYIHQRDRLGESAADFIKLKSDRDE